MSPVFLDFAGYLALSGCESTVFAMIAEMPLLKFYVPGQPPGVSKADYIRMLGRPSLTPSLSDLLNDYGNSKMFGKFFYSAVILSSFKRIKFWSLTTYPLKTLNNFICRYLFDVFSYRSDSKAKTMWQSNATV